MKSAEKTNVMRILDQKNIKYISHCYINTNAISGIEVATVLKQNPDQLFKTLVTVGTTNTNYVFLVPVDKELDLKKAANVVHEKSIEMVKSKDLLNEMVKKGELTVEQGKVLNEELKHNIKKTVRENVNVSVKASSPEELDELLSKMRPEQLEALKERIRSMESGETVEAEEVIDLEDDDSAETEDVESDE